MKEQSFTASGLCDRIPCSPEIRDRNELAGKFLAREYRTIGALPGYALRGQAPSLLSQIHLSRLSVFRGTEPDSSGQDQGPRLSASKALPCGTRKNLWAEVYTKKPMEWAAHILDLIDQKWPAPLPPVQQAVRR